MSWLIWILIFLGGIALATAVKHIILHPVVPPLTVTVVDTDNVLIGKSFSIDAAIDGGFPPYAASLAGAPDWVSVSVNGNVATISGAVPAGQSADVPIDLTVTDSAA